MVYFPFTALRCPMQNRKHHKERNCHHHKTSQHTQKSGYWKKLDVYFPSSE